MYQDPNQRQDAYSGYGDVPQSSNPYGTPPLQSSQPLQQNPYGTRPNYQQQNLSRPRHWYGNGRRVFYGGLWSFYTILFAIGFFHFMSVGSFTTALISAGLALLLGNYAYRIWTWRARHLWLLIFF